MTVRLVQVWRGSSTPTTGTATKAGYPRDDPVLVEAVEHSTTSIGHNAYTEGRFLFASNYTAG